MGYLIIIPLYLAAIYGWIMNIVTLWGMHDPLVGEGLVRIAGIFLAPLGAVMGYL